MTTLESQAHPLQLAELDGAWVERVLRAAFPDADARVHSIAVERIGEGVGFLGELGRITLDYTGARNPALPPSLIAKFSAPDAGLRAFVAMFGFYRSEVMFYRDIAGVSPLRTPRCYFAAVSDDGARCALLFEDLSLTGTVGDQVAGCTLEHARAALDELAAFHAATHADPRLAALPWVVDGPAQLCRAFETTYPLAWSVCAERYGHLYPQHVRDAMPTLDQSMLRMLTSGMRNADTLSHGDFRLDNLFFGAPGADYRVAAVDWQLLNRGFGAYDVAYFLITNVDTAVRTKDQFDLLRAYHERLRAGGVSDYVWDDCVEDYRRAALIMLGVQIMGVPQIDTANDRGVALFELIGRRLAAALEDLDAFALLDN